MTSPFLKGKYDRLKKLTKCATEKARNSWWSVRAAEAERQAYVAEQMGRGGSLVKDLQPASSSLQAKNGTTLQNDGEKLNRWAEHFEELMNCQVQIDAVHYEDIPIISPAPTIKIACPIMSYVHLYRKM